MLAFDELRRTCLELFAQVGEALRQAAQPKRIVDLLPGDELAALAVDVQRAANLCAPLAVPDGLQPIAALAAELQACASTRVVPILIAFHRSEGRSWIEPVGADRLQLGHAGPFQRPSGFHGYTLNAAFSVHADLSVGQA